VKITKRHIRRIIREELVRELHDPLDPHAGGSKPNPEVQSVFDEAGLSPEEGIEVQGALSGDDTDWLSSSSYEKLFNYYLDSGEMPYGIAKAREGDPDYWILDQLEELGA